MSGWGTVSLTVMSSPGAPQGTILALLLFALYMADFRYSSLHFESSYNQTSYCTVVCLKKP